mmetsp:Transcript_34302/g.85484  ORF Transcript_34302/g.85484 Transcript_34302/m.85484 type:complete len:316 (+) Transcript_34302:34-981(+)
MKAMFTTRPSARGTESGPSKAENLIRNMRPTAPADTKAEPAKYSFDPTEYLYKNLSEADADKLRTQQAAAHTLLVQHTTSAYDAGKTLLRASHIVNQYVSLAAGILVCLSSAEAFVEIIFGGIGLWFIGGLTQFYLFCFGLTIIVLEVPIMDKTTPVLKFKVMIDKWFRALSRLTARGIVYFTHAVLIINAQEDYSKFAILCGYFLFIAGFFTVAVGMLTTMDAFNLKELVRSQVDSNGNLMRGADQFTAADTDNNGHLSKDEVIKMVKKLQPLMTPLEIDAMWLIIDTNQDGSVSIEEFMLWYDRIEFSTEDLA